MLSFKRTLVFIRRDWSLPAAVSLLLTAPAAAQAPVLTALTPARNALAAPRGANLAATFSLPLAAAATTGIKVFSNQAGGLKAGVATVSGSTITFNPARDFRPGEIVRTTFTTAVRSAGGAGGVALVKPIVTQFTAAAGVGPATFLGGPLLPTGAGSSAIGDIDGDGDEDLTVTSNGTLISQLNDGVGQFTAGPVSMLNTGAGGGVVTLGDVDGDHDLDALIYTSAGVAVRLNNGTGTFSGNTAVPVGIGAYQIVLADIDGDGDLDLLTAGYNAAAVRFNDGTGQFSGTVSLSTGANNYALTVGDVDSDGDLDLVTTSYTTNNYTVGNARLWLNQGNGTFAATATNFVTTALPASAFLVDIDADADLDLLVGSSNTGKVTVMRNSGAGAFTPDTTQPLVGRALGAVADVDGDGDLDLLGNDFYTSQLSIAANDGTGTFSAPRHAALGNTPYTLVVADLDGDAALDIVTTNQNAGVIQVLFNRVPVPVITSFTPTSGPAGTTVTLTGTGFRDTRRLSVNNTVAPGFAVQSPTRLTVTVPVGATTGRIRVLTPAGTATSATDFTVTGPPSPTVTARLPERHAPAVARASSVGITFSQAVTAASAANVRVFSSQARGRRAGTFTGGGTASLSFQPTQPFAPGERVSVSVPTTVQAIAGPAVRPYVYDFTAAAAPALAQFTSLPNLLLLNGAPRSAAAADVDGDGDPDLLVATDNGLLVRRNDGTGTCAGTGLVAAILNATALAMGDVDNDGDLDALVANPAGLNVARNNGTGVFTALPAVATGRDAAAVAVGDVDGDGDLDALLANISGNSVSVRLNDGTGVFSGYYDEPVGAQPGDVTVGDVDNDGDLDFVSANIGDSTVRVRLNDGTGGFLPGPAIGVGAPVSAVALGDVDGDGLLDMAISYPGQNATVAILRGIGAGQFGGRADLLVGRYLHNILLADMNGDGHLDLVVSVAIDGGIVWLNDGTGAFAPAPGTPTGTNPGSTNSARHVACADMDGDGTLDMITTDLSFISPSAVVQLNQPLLAVAAEAATASRAGLWPNPARDAVSVALPAPTPARVDLLDATGRVVHTLVPQRTATTARLPLAGLPAGVYVVRCGPLARRLVVD